MKLPPPNCSTRMTPCIEPTLTNLSLARTMGPLFVVNSPLNYSLMKIIKFKTFVINYLKKHIYSLAKLFTFVSPYMYVEKVMLLLNKII